MLASSFAFTKVAPRFRALRRARSERAIEKAVSEVEVDYRARVDVAPHVRVGAPEPLAPLSVSDEAIEEDDEAEEGRRSS